MPNNDYKLKPGMTANVTIEVAKKTDVVRVPNAATRFRPSTEIFAALGQPALHEAHIGRAVRVPKEVWGRVSAELVREYGDSHRLSGIDDNR